MNARLLSIKELAAELGRNRTFVAAMKRRRFKMPGGRATLAAALAWLERNPKPRARNTTEQRGTPAGFRSAKARA